MQPLWWMTRDGDRACKALHEQHYSCHHYRDGRKPRKFVGPGENVVLRTWAGDAFFVWRKFRDKCIDFRTGQPQAGVNCSAFRKTRKGPGRIYIRQAMRIARTCWPDCRCYTYVNPKEVASRHAGWCFIRAGWVKCGYTQGGLLILEYLAQWPVDEKWD